MHFDDEAGNLLLLSLAITPGATRVHNALHDVAGNYICSSLPPSLSTFAVLVLVVCSPPDGVPNSCRSFSSKETSVTWVSHASSALTRAASARASVDFPAPGSPHIRGLHSSTGHLNVRLVSAGHVGWFE